MVNFRCCNTDAFMNLLPNHVASYLPLLITCMSCPFLFVSAFRQAETSLMRRYARYTTTERKLIDSLKLKFILIVSVFYLCWVPNLVNGFVLWLDWTNLPMTWVVVNWHLMVFNHMNELFSKEKKNLFTFLHLDRHYLILYKELLTYCSTKYQDDASLKLNFRIG